MNDKKTIPNRPTDLGREVGTRLAKFVDQAEIEQRKKFPNHAERCKSCAFRAGTFPNGCETTIMDAIKCVIEQKPFYCHQKLDDDGNPTELCAGWALMVSNESKPMSVPWEFSE